MVDTTLETTETAEITKVQLFQIAAPKDKVSYEFSSGVETANAIFRGLFIIETWGQRQALNPLALSKVEGPVLLEQLDFQTQELVDVHNQTRALLDKRLPIPEEVFHSNTKAQEIRITSKEEVEAALKKLQLMIHDIGTALTPVRGFAEVMKENGMRQDFLEVINKRSGEIVLILEDGFKSIQNIYSKETLTVDDIVSQIRKNLFHPEIKIHVDANAPNKEVLWSKGWFLALLDNVMQNTEKAYRAKPQAEKTLTVRLEHSQVKNSPFFDIIFEDQGKGFPAEIEKDGFKFGITDWGDPHIPGTGTGMASHAEVIERYYGGQLIPENRRDEKGKIVGARLIVRLPLLSGTRELNPVLPAPKAGVLPMN